MKIIIGVKKLIFDLHLAAVWRLLANLKFAIGKKTLQLRARLMRGDDQLKKELTLFFKGKKAYQPFTHPGLQDIPFRRGGETRFKIIKENLSLTGGTLLDIGANFGYFCRKFEEEGFDCYAVEENRILCYFMEKLKKACLPAGRAENKKFKVIPESIFEYKKNQELVFDVILALSIFHNFLEREDLYLNLIKLLKRLKAKELFFETYLPEHFQSANYYKHFAPDEFVDFIIKNSSFSRAKLIGKSEEGRPIYKLTP